jgi:hypothetical protein
LVLSLAVGSFAACILFSARTFLYMVSGEIIEENEPGRGTMWLITRGSWSIRWSMYSFVCGIGLLAVFLVFNINR